MYLYVFFFSSGGAGFHKVLCRDVGLWVLSSFAKRWRPSAIEDTHFDMALEGIGCGFPSRCPVYRSLPSILGPLLEKRSRCFRMSPHIDEYARGVCVCEALKPRQADIKDERI